jgi:hypothetical protein
VKNGPSLGGYGAVAMNAALTASITTLPDQLRKTLTWDRGKELSGHAQFAMETGTRVFFADPHSPWQRPTNENTYWYKMAGPEASSTGVALVRAVRVTRRTRAERLSVDMSTAARWARALTGSDLIEAC